MSARAAIVARSLAAADELSALHDANTGKRTAILLVELLQKKFDSDDFVYRFLHLLDFIDFGFPAHAFSNRVKLPGNHTVYR